tara:strand:- start:193 stop:1131 length:939 start_codon:yes stop_codon:yes gene_type:complete
MTNVYWGGRAYGKVNMQCLFRYNRKTVSQHAHHKYKLFKWEYVGDKQIRTRYYQEIDKDNITRYVKNEEVTDEWLLETQTDKGLKNNTHVEFDWLGKGTFSIPDEKMKTLRRKDGSEILYEPKDLYPIYEDDIDVWYDHFANDIITCDLYNPIDWLLEQEDHRLLRILKGCRNVVGYKDNMHDWLMGLIGFFVPWESSRNWGIEVTDPHDAYTKNPEICFSDFDHHIKQNRNVEQRLQDLGIEYEYLNLDTDDYAKFFELERNLPRTNYNRTHMYKEIAPERYEIAEHIVNHYIKDRNLTGWKLEGRIHDKI